jgi:hypothetical protein
MWTHYLPQSWFITVWEHSHFTGAVVGVGMTHGLIQALTPFLKNEIGGLAPPSL